MSEKLTIETSRDTDGLSVRALRVYKIIARELNGRTDFVNYGLIAQELGTDWNKVKSAVNALCKAGVLRKDNNTLTVIKELSL